MSHWKLLSLPVFCFAHEYGTERYDARLPRRSGLIEISCITEGTCTLTRAQETYTACEGDILCNSYEDELHIISDGVHRHRTVCFAVDIEATEESGDLPCAPSLDPSSQGERYLYIFKETLI